MPRTKARCRFFCALLLIIERRFSMIIVEESNIAKQFDSHYYSRVIDNKIKANRDSTVLSLEFKKTETHHGERMILELPLSSKDISDLHYIVSDRCDPNSDYSCVVKYIDSENSGFSVTIGGLNSGSKRRFISKVIEASQTIVDGIKSTKFDSQKNDIVAKMTMLAISELAYYCADYYNQGSWENVTGVDAIVPDPNDTDATVRSIIDTLETRIHIRAIKFAVVSYIAGAGLTFIGKAPTHYYGGISSSCSQYGEIVSTKVSPLLSAYVSNGIKARLLNFALHMMYPNFFHDNDGRSVIVGSGPEKIDSLWWNDDGFINYTNPEFNIISAFSFSLSKNDICAMLFASYVRMRTIMIAEKKSVIIDDGEDEDELLGMNIVNPIGMLQIPDSKLAKFMTSSLLSDPDYMTESNEFGGYGRSRMVVSIYPFSNVSLSEPSYCAWNGIVKCEQCHVSSLMKYQENNECAKEVETNPEAASEFMDFAIATFKNEAVRIAFVVRHMPWLFLKAIVENGDLLKKLMNEVTGGIPEMRIFAFKEILSEFMSDPDSFNLDGDELSWKINPSSEFDKLFETVEKLLPSMTEDVENALALEKYLFVVADSGIRGSKWNDVRLKCLKLFIDNYDLFDKATDRFFEFGYVKDEPKEIRRLAVIEYAMGASFSMGVTARFIYAMTGGPMKKRNLAETAAEIQTDSKINGYSWENYYSEYESAGKHTSKDEEGKPFCAGTLYGYDRSSVYESAIIPLHDRQCIDVFSKDSIGCVKSDLLRKDILYISLLEGIASLATYMNTKFCPDSSTGSLSKTVIRQARQDKTSFELLRMTEAWSMTRMLTKRLCNICFKSTKRFFYRMLYATKLIFYSFNSVVIRKSDSGIVPADDPLGTIDGIRISMAKEFIVAVSESFLSQSAKDYLLFPNDLSNLSAITDYQYTDDEEKDHNNMRKILEIRPITDHECTCGIYDDDGHRIGLDWKKSRFFLGLGIVPAMAAVNAADKCPDEVSSEYLMRYLKKGDDSQ